MHSCGLKPCRLVKSINTSQEKTERDDGMAGCNQYAFGKEVVSFVNLRFYRETEDLNATLLMRVSHMQAFFGTEKLSKEIAEKFFCPVIYVIRRALLGLCFHPSHRYIYLSWWMTLHYGKCTTCLSEWVGKCALAHTEKLNFNFVFLRFVMNYMYLLNSKECMP